MNYLQKTLRNKITCRGIGIHSGKPVKMVLCPAPVDNGIVFRRKDIKDKKRESIPAKFENVSRTTLGTNLTNQYDVEVSTVEHLMAALWGMEIDNCFIDLNSSEIPIMDGSAEPFVFLIECAGIKNYTTPRKFIKVKKPIKLEEKHDKYMAYSSVEPANYFEIDFEIDFPNKTIAKQKYNFSPIKSSFKTEISRARTFGMLEEVEYLKSQGLAQGGSLNNAIVVGNDGIINPNGYRSEGEFVRHKILDTLGDLYLCGYHIVGKFTCYRSGHSLNNKLLRALFQDKDAWEFIEAPISA
jgi:UDP-3-O-[3-hydroxymyristoyl] N-acetylglucosamine deacetylase